MLAALNESCMGSADRDIVDTVQAVQDGSADSHMREIRSNSGSGADSSAAGASATSEPRHATTKGGLGEFGASSTEAPVSTNEASSPAAVSGLRALKGGLGSWGKLRHKVALIHNEAEDRAAATGSRPDFLSVLNLALRDSELLKLAEKKQQEMDEADGMLDASFARRAPDLGNGGREKLHQSFKSRRRASISASPAMLQALQAAQKKQESSIKQATEKQARVLVEGRMVLIPMDKGVPRRARRLSGGMEALTSSAAFTTMWAKNGTHDDRFRPENNQVGSVPFMGARVAH